MTNMVKARLILGWVLENVNDTAPPIQVVASYAVGERAKDFGLMESPLGP